MCSELTGRSRIVTEEWLLWASGAARPLPPPHLTDTGIRVWGSSGNACAEKLLEQPWAFWNLPRGPQHPWTNLCSVVPWRPRHFPEGREQRGRRGAKPGSLAALSCVSNATWGQLGPKWLLDSLPASCFLPVLFVLLPKSCRENSLGLVGKPLIRGLVLPWEQKQRPSHGHGWPSHGRGWPFHGCVWPSHGHG